MKPGEVITLEGDLILNQKMKSFEMQVSNSGDRPIQVGSHFHFAETNEALKFDRVKAFGCRLNIPSGTAVRFEPGQIKICLLYTSPSPRDRQKSRMPSSA